ncbi:hypothetical protein [Lacisediminihabitans changchengi]|uniref:Uncharacterized protein n=1 Tax=Lacisediminihabitans changchengi TaxID=2787634 RepID=A0A934W1U4_9MICO|nr:hypothetical protein [Lacisediminihabitans changchengi]MBK4347238.1 hypothetical protein [Lacisediminihabitans changchengi]
MTVATSFAEFSSGSKLSKVSALPDLVFPRYVRIEVEDEPGTSVDFVLLAVFDLAAHRYVVDSIEVRRRAPGDDVNAVALRSVRVQEFLRRGLMDAIGTAESVETADGYMPPTLSEKRAAEIRFAGPSDLATLTWVARFYARAEALSMQPARAVQESIGIPAPTASVWIRRARDRGLLSPLGVQPEYDDMPGFAQDRASLDLLR